MSRAKWLISAVGVWGLLATYSALSDDHAKHVISEEITGVVVESGSDKPIPDAVVAIRFTRGNTGHGSPHCFRSMAVKANEQGRFRFVPWSQENTRANGTYGEVVAYKKGYSVRPNEPVYVTQSRRKFLGIRFSSDIHIPKSDVKVELNPWLGLEEERMNQLKKMVGDFSCRWNAEFDDRILSIGVRDEIAGSSLANQKVIGEWRPLEWINAFIDADQPAEKR